MDFCLIHPLKFDPPHSFVLKALCEEQGDRHLVLLTSKNYPLPQTSLMQGRASCLPAQYSSLMEEPAPCSQAGQGDG